MHPNLVNYFVSQPREGEAAFQFLCGEKSTFFHSLTGHTFTELTVTYQDLDTLLTSCL